MLAGEKVFDLSGRQVAFEEEQVSERGAFPARRLQPKTLVDLFLGADPFADGQLSQENILAALHGDSHRESRRLRYRSLPP
jgi:hypothetical protein